MTAPVLRNRPWLTRLADYAELLHLSLKLQLGKRFWLYPLLPLCWPAFLMLLRITGINSDSYSALSVQNILVGLPMVLLAIVIGMQIVSSEIEQRTLEVCYTVPGGARRIWQSKLCAALVLLLCAEALLAVFAWLVVGPFPPGTLYRSLQGALFYLVLSMAFGAWFRNKMTAGMASLILLFFNGVVTEMGNSQTRYSPLFNPLGLEGTGASSEEIVYWLIQNHVGFAVLMLTLVVLTFARAERRELLLSDD